jgi:DNA polymerase (family 10)
MKLLDALKLAELIRDRVLAEFCERVEIVGSVRRARDVVNDIDFVCLPKPGQLGALRARVAARNNVLKDGPEFLSVANRDGVQVDIWFAHAGGGDMFRKISSNWGSLVLCRTGSKEHNIFLADRAKSMGLKWKTSTGLVANPDSPEETVVAGVTEEEIFQTLGMGFIPPALRERGGAAAAAPQEGPDWAEAFNT